MTNVVKPHFTVEDEAETVTPTPAQKSDHQAALRMLMLGLSALGQRTLHALADLFCLLTVGSAFWLFMSVPDPNTYQLAQLFGYCGFIVVVNWIVRRR